MFKQSLKNLKIKTVATLFCAFAIMLQMVSCSSSSDKTNLIPVKSNGQWGYVNKSGDFVIQPQFSYAGAFHDGLAAICQGEKFGYIDESGAYVIYPQFKKANRFYDGIAVVNTSDDLVGFINKSCDYILGPIDLQDYSHFYEGLAIISPYDGYPYSINTKGDVVHVFDGFVEVLPYKDGKAIAIREDNSSAVFDKNGNIIGETPYRITKPFCECYAAFNAKGNKQGALDASNGFLDEEMNVVVAPIYDKVHDFVDGVAVVEKQSFDMNELNTYLDADIQSGYGLIDKNGDVLLNLEYKYISDFSEGLAVVNTENGFGYTDTEGNFVINPQFDYATDFSEGLAMVAVNSKCGFIDKNGKMIINPQFDYALAFHDGFSIVVKSEGAGIINKNGEYIVPAILEDVNPEVANNKNDDEYNSVNSYYNTNSKICDNFISMIFHGNDMFDFEQYTLGDYAIMDGCNVENEHQVSVYDEKSKVLHNGYFNHPIYNVRYDYWGDKKYDFNYDDIAGVTKATFGYEFWKKNNITTDVPFTCYSLLKLMISKLQKKYNVSFDNMGNGMYVCYDEKSGRGAGLQVEDDNKSLMYGPISTVFINDMDVFDRFESIINK